ncbi:MAG: response regulator, partial [Candidatus Eremiobacteraeota bacterium]|nr:response regulator [Candidatus Eremiobacteraeota bacterium]
MVIVDDVNVHFQVIKEIASVQAYAFSSTALALAVSRSVMPELFVVNHRPPRIDGARFVADLRADADLAGVPVLLLASETDRRTCYEALDHGADDFLLSPVDRHELRRRVMRVLAIEEARTRAGLLPVVPVAEPLMVESAVPQPSSMSRLAVTTGIDDAAFVSRVIREAAQSLGDEVPFSGALLRLDQNAWVVENAYRPDGANACLPDAGTRVELDDVTVCEVLRTGTTLVVRDSRSDERFRDRPA